MCYNEPMLIVKAIETIGDFGSILVGLFALWSLWTFGLGLLGGWFLSKGTLSPFPKVKKSDRLLILAPHIDDEVLGAAGLIQQTRLAGAEILVVYATNGDDNPLSLWGQSRVFDPNDFITLGENRMKEGLKATARLGLEKKDSLFLGYPDGGLGPMRHRFFDPGLPYTARGTRFNHNPYRGTYRTGQPYSGSHLCDDLELIIEDFRPTLIIAPHPRDSHPDHRALFQFLEKILEEKENEARLYAYLVHFRFWPPKKKLKMNDFLSPPKKLFSGEGWYSLDLSIEQENRKLQAIEKNASQLTLATPSDLLRSFVKRNEIFEEIEPAKDE